MTDYYHILQVAKLRKFIVNERLIRFSGQHQEYIEVFSSEQLIHPVIMMQSACIAVAEAAKWLYNVLTDFIEGLSKAITKVGGELYRSQKAIDNQ